MEQNKFTYSELLYLQLIIKQNIVDNKLDYVKDNNAFKKTTSRLLNKVIRSLNEIRNK